MPTPRGTARQSGGISRSQDTVMAQILLMRMDAPNITSGRASKRSSRDVTTYGLGWGFLLLLLSRGRKMCNGCRGVFGEASDMSHKSTLD